MPPEGPSKPYRRHERGLLRPDKKPGFNTPTGKVEVYSETFKQWGLDPLPFYTEPPQSAASTPELFKKYPLVMITGARSQLYFHSEHRMIPWLREKMPDPTVEIHPDTAKTYGIDDGEWIYLENDMGRVKRKANDHPQGQAAPCPHHARLVAARTRRQGAEPVRRVGLSDQQDHSRARNAASPGSAAASTRPRSAR